MAENSCRKRADDNSLGSLIMKNLRPFARKCRRLLRETQGKILRRLGLLEGDWAAGLPAELQFWEKALKDGGRNWEASEYRERTDPNLELQEELKQIIPAAPGAVVRILDVGAGPLTRLGKHWPGRNLQIVAVDPLAEQYAAMLARISLRPLVPVTFAHAEKLLDHFSPNSFDLAYASNSLDHSYDPLAAISQMLAVVKPGCYAYLWHFANEGTHESYRGLHQWNFDAVKNDFVISDGKSKHSLASQFKSTAALTCETTQAFGARVVIAKLKKLEAKAGG
jgi:SAM-dependent methyltransferase